MLKTCFEGVPGLEGVDHNTPGLDQQFDIWLVKAVLDGVSRIILTQVGEGPEKVEGKSLINSEGEPNKSAS